MNIENINVLHCAHLVGGQASNIARSERLLGARSIAVSWEESKFGYPADEILFQKNAGLFRQEVSRYQLYARAIKDYDVIHYNNGAPILNWGALDGRHKKMVGGLGAPYAMCNMAIELPVMKYLGKVIAVTYQGDDARQGDYSRNHFDVCIANEVGDNYYSSESDQAKRSRIAKFAKYADIIYALNPDLLHVLPSHAQFLPYAHVNLNEWVPVSDSLNKRPLVVHAPSHRGVKGTRFLLAAVERLRAEGLQFDFQLVEGLTQCDARKIYERADLVVDQLLAGWYGGFAVEVMALGKPVVCYLRQADLNCLPIEMRRELPIIETSPNSVDIVLRQWLLRPLESLRQQGIKGRRYVEKWHDPMQIGRRLIDDYFRVINKKKINID